MITLYDFLHLAMEDYYLVNIFYNNTGTELLHQVEISQVEEQLEELGYEDLMFHEVGSWDIIETKNNEFTLNID